MSNPASSGGLYESGDIVTFSDYHKETYEKVGKVPGSLDEYFFKVKGKFRPMLVVKREENKSEYRVLKFTSRASEQRVLWQKSNGSPRSLGKDFGLKHQSFLRLEPHEIKHHSEASERIFRIERQLFEQIEKEYHNRMLRAPL